MGTAKGRQSLRRFRYIDDSESDREGRYSAFLSIISDQFYGCDGTWPLWCRTLARLHLQRRHHFLDIFCGGLHLVRVLPTIRGLAGCL